ncbi:MAG TPA: hypothetical protein EYP56_13850 [Planctomycetaceae bacterium]|nr:hypothetical protein [Planctomycetaceae bacterium]
MSPSADPAGPGGTVVPLSAGAPPVGTSPGPSNQLAPADSSAGETEPRSRVLVVDPSGQYPEALSSLGAALARAASGDVIQLRYNGPNERDERAFSLADLALTIRAAPGFRPVVRYVPKSDPALYPSAMFSLTGAHVIMEGLALELEVPAEMAVESWSMFEMGPADQLELRRCWLTVRNSAAQPEAAFFRLRAPLALSLRRRNGPDNARRPARLTLSDCVARGEAALLSAEDAVPAEVAWNNGLLVTTQQLLRARGTDRSPGPADQLRIQLDHVTAAVGGSLCAWSDGLLAPRQLPTQIISSHCVLQGNNTAPLGIQETVKDVEEVLATVQWHGRGNCYGGFSSFWVVRSAAKGGQPRTWSLAQWLQRVGPESETGSVAIESPWRRPPPVDLPVSQHLPADYLLRDGVGAGDSVGAGPPGFALDELPDPPPEAVPPAGQSTAPRATAPMDPGP